MYQTFASGGFRMPLRAIREVTTATGQPLQRYPLKVDKAIEPGPAYLITKAMQRVIQAGTAKAMSQKIPATMGIAGKTGTTDDYRDSWFAGFSGDKMTVVWLGRDDNNPTGLSGANGALPVWIEIMDNLYLEPLDLVPPPSIQEVSIDPRSGLRASRSCGGAQSLPFLEGSAPRATSSCGAELLYSNRGDVVPDGGVNQDGAESEPVGSRQPAPHQSAPSPSAPESDPISDFFKRLLK
jgi:penicillin-binding protein 1B